MAEPTQDAAGEPLSAPAHSPFKVLFLLLHNWTPMVKYAKMNKICMVDMDVASPCIDSVTRIGFELVSFVLFVSLCRS